MVNLIFYNYIIFKYFNVIIDQNYKKKFLKNSVVDLVTHQEKQMEKKKHKLGAKNTRIHVN